jgi:phosphoglycerate dehydrogenase-like enzyme
MNAPAVPSRPRVALFYRTELDRWLLPPAARERLAAVADIVTPPLDAAAWRGHASALRDVDAVLGSWGIPRFDAELLAAMPRLRAVFYAAGSVRGFVTPEFWDRGVVLSTAVGANAGPTATFAEAMVVLSLKQVWFYLRERRADWAYLADTASSGVHGATVGIIGLSRVGRAVVQGLRRHELRLLAFDPTVDAAAAAKLGVELVPLDELFARSDVVSLHAPLLPSTVGLIRAEHLRKLGRHATFVNTARGAIVDEAGMVEVLRERPDLTAVLDVTDPEPAPADSPLRQLPNVVLTPHLAGARHREIELLGRAAVDDLARWVRGEPLTGALDAAAAANSA